VIGDRPEREAADVRSGRLRSLTPYLFEELTRLRDRKVAQGSDIIDLSIGDPDIGAPGAAVRALKKYAGDRRLDRYTPAWAVREFNEAAAGFMLRRYSVSLDPASEIAPVIGTKEGLANLALAVVDPGAAALVPDPGYPVYGRSVGFAGGVVRSVPLKRENGFLPDLRDVEGQGVRLVFLNYPNNPTSAVAPPDFFQAAVEFGKRHRACVVNDAAYAEITFDGYESPSILQAEGAGGTAVEFHSLSKTYGIPGWRVGFVAGRRDAVAALSALKSNIDSGVPGMMLLAARDMLEEGGGLPAGARREYARRRELIRRALRAAGISYHESPATLYIWAGVPGGMPSRDFAGRLLEEAGVMVAPGLGFGAAGEGYFRISITCGTARVAEAAERIEEACRKWMS
jgi:LL-diaminopimelate aminotransferase